MSHSNPRIWTLRIWTLRIRMLRIWMLIVAALIPVAGTYGATYSTARVAQVDPPLLRLSVSRTLPGCTDTSERCWTTSPQIRALAVAPGERFGLAVGCDAQPVGGVVRFRFLYIPIETLVDHDCLAVELAVNPGEPTPTLSVDHDGHQYTRSLPFDQWTPLQLVDADPVVYLRLERAESDAR